MGAAWGGEAAAPPAQPPLAVQNPEKALASWTEQVKHPLPFFTWGAEYRLRQEYFHNVFDFSTDKVIANAKDNRDVIRNRLRLWMKLGPFFADEAMEAPNGLSFYTRFLWNPRYYLQAEFGRDYPNPDWDERIVDNLYAEWQRIGGLPVSLRVGRQDFAYGRGFVLMDATPLDGSRTTYADAIKGTIHLDELRSTLDLFAMDNKGEENHRLRPWDWDGNAVDEYNARVYGAYLTNKSFKDTEIGLYYIYKHEDPIDAIMPFKTTRYNDVFGKEIVHTLGAMVQGKLAKEWDYYAELAGQWGEHGYANGRDVPRKAYAFSSDLGYTFLGIPWTPRLHGGYEFLSGDDPNTSTYEGWDPVLGRWSRWSDLFGYHSAVEYGRIYYLTNLQRCFLGASVKPTDKLKLSLDYSYLRTDEFEPGTAGPFGGGRTRGNLFLGIISYDVCKNLQTRIWTEYFKPGSYYARRDSALLFQWQAIFSF